jgi:putative aldouronate transport system permease protein
LDPVKSAGSFSKREELDLASVPMLSTVKKVKLKREKTKFNLKRTWPLHVLVLPALLLTVVFSYVPMAGVVIAFEDYKPYLGVFKSPWIGMEQFQLLLTYPDVKQVVWNTLLIAAFKIVFGLIVPLVVALLLNEIRQMLFKRSVQTLIYLPHFLSWVILAGILQDLLSVKFGLVNRILDVFGVKPIYFLGNGDWFRFTLVVSDIWKEFGFSTIIYLAALTAVNPSLFEAAAIDGASRWKQLLHITIPAIIPITIVVATLAMGNILNAGFDQVFNLYNPLVYKDGDIIDTFVYRMGILSAQFSFSTAVGLFKSAVSFILISVTYIMAFKYANYRIF